ncbi:uncharacterized protein LOC129571069, partial [Sitodiplosis mosellana]|uniref:uncharacterized protein LOC129571069 n=1 Tax=Sitodiplosis mosellana TaxID=263140 RepID=UPI0024447C91
MENANELVELEVCESAFNRRLHTFNIVNKVTRVDIKGFLWDAFPIYKLEISSTHELHNMVKSSTTLVAEFEKKILKASEINASGPSTNASESDTVEETIVQTLYFTSRTTKIGLNVDWKRHYKHNVIEELKESVENAAIEGSGFKLRNLIKLNVQVSSFRPLLGGSFIEAPIKLKKRGAIINVKNENDNMCFKWAILSCLHNNKIQKNANRLCLYKRYENDLNFDGIDFPVSLKDIDKFEKQNENISINVYFYDNDSDLVSTLRVSDDIKEKHIHLLMLTASNRVNTDGAMSTAGKVKMMLESDQVQTHYCWIKSLSRLIDHQLTDHGHKSSGAKSDCIEWFIEELSYISNFVEKQLKKNVPMKWEDWDDDFVFQNNNHCSICTLEFEPDDTRVRDHCHFTGKFRGPAHVSCNLNYQESREIPIIMHNLSGYDAHLFIKQLATQMEGDVNIIPSNSEQYISFTKIVNDSIHHPSEHKDKIKLKFLDSCRFMPAGLAELASLIPTEEKRILYKEFERKYSSELLHMLERKGVFPYDYVDSLDRLRETALPSKEQFYSKLYEEDIEDDEYEFAQQIWEKFGIKSLGEYAELYLKTDVLLLADVFENFRETCHKIYNLDPAHYYTAPGLSWDAMLKYTDVVIELITDVDMLLFVERGIRGGITQCNKRYVEANNKYMREGYDPNKKTNYLMYLDANNLYGHAMCQPLPISDYKWADFDLSNVDNMVEIIKNLSEDSDTGYIFEVDLDYPEHLHADHNDFPFCAERTKLPQQAFDILKDK